MAHMRKDYGGFAGLALILWALIFGAYLLIKPFFIADESPHSLPHRPRAQSWDQETLKRLAPKDDRSRPCPEVYDAPGGNLRFCG